MRIEQYTIEEIQSKIIDTCERLYGPMDHDSYFVVPDRDENSVRVEILDNMEDPDMAKTKYLDMSVYVLQTGKDVFIKVV